jgi:hypothetical protein
MRRRLPEGRGDDHARRLIVRIGVLIAAAIALAACDNAPTGRAPDTPIINDTIATNAPISPEQAGDLPEPSEGLRFVGRWAADERSCTSAAWVFTQTTLRTPAGSVCSFDQVTPVPGGYDIQATCTAEAPPASDTLKIRFAESAKAMLFESETIADTGLVFCGREA